MSFQMRLVLMLLLCLPALSQAQAQEGGDTLNVFFRLDEDHLSVAEEDRLDSLLYLGRLRPSQSLRLVGYADFLGGEGYNQDLSARRAEAVQRYLIRSGFQKDKIVLVMGKGKIERPGTADPSGYGPDRRVDIVVERITAKPMRENPKATTSTLVLQNGLPDPMQLKVNETFLLDHIYFPLGSHLFKKESLPALDQLVQLLEDHPGLKIRIEGHVCCIGPGLPDALDEETGEMSLSVNRARFIQDYLLRKGIPAARLSYQGFGHSRPIIPNEQNEEEARQNRRVEIRILEH